MDVTSRRISLTAWGRLYGFDKATMSRLHRQGKLPPDPVIETLPTGRHFVVLPGDRPEGCVLYARVSSADQREDLDRQVGRLSEWATDNGYMPTEVVKEVGSGLNGSRKRLLKVLGDGSVDTIVVEHRDRLCRFGFEYVEAALAAHGCRVLVIDDAELEDDPVSGTGQALVRDVTEVMTSLCARLYGRRSARRRAERAMKAVRDGEKP